MQNKAGWWFPDGETHMPEWMERSQTYRDNRLQYQYAKYIRAMQYVRPVRRTAIDVGANVGLWSRNMATDFVRLAAFEPVPMLRQCWGMNVQQLNARLYPIALGAVQGVVALHCKTPGSYGDTKVIAGLQEGDIVAYDVDVCRLDDFKLKDVDFIKIDCEGYEKFVVEGGESTIRGNKPCLIVEQKPGHGKTYGLADDAAIQILTRWGAVVREVISGDYILSWD